MAAEAGKVNKKFALLAGSNYEGTPFSLSGTQNDLKSMKKLLKTRFGFQGKDMTVLDDEATDATGANIKRTLKELVSKCNAAGDLLLFYFSGHGFKGHFSDEDSKRMDQAIVPSDFNLITEVDFRDVLEPMSPEATFVFISDSCHSGALLDKPELQIQDTPVVDPPSDAKRKQITHDELVNFLKLGTKPVEEYMQEHFGSDASEKFLKTRDFTPVNPDMAVLITACAPEEVSYEMRDDFMGQSGPHGAFTAALITVLGQNPKPITNKHLVVTIRKELEKHEIVVQNPYLYCNVKNASVVFLLQLKPQKDLMAEGKTKKKYALLAGSNYENTPFKLSGTQNDLKSMKGLLKTRFGFQGKDITLLNDEGTEATGAKIKHTLRELVSKCNAEDLLLFYFSGLGTKGHFSTQDKERMNHAIVPSDFNLITDVDFQEVLGNMNTEATFVFISDSCHSGGLIDQVNLQVRDDPISKSWSKQITHEELVSFLKLGTKPVEEYMQEQFGPEASQMFFKPRHFRPVNRDRVVLISACGPEEVSYDMGNGFMKQPSSHGAFTAALVTVLGRNPAPFTNKDLVLTIKTELDKHHMSQHPLLYCNEQNASVVFLLQDPLNVPNPGTTTKPKFPYNLLFNIKNNVPYYCHVM